MMRTTIQIYLTPIVMFVWAAIIVLLHYNNMPIRLVTTGIAVAIQIRTLFVKYLSNRNDNDSIH